MSIDVLLKAEEVIHRSGRIISRLEKCKRTALLWLMVFAMAFYSLGCNSGNSSARLPASGPRAMTSSSVSTQAGQTTSVAPSRAGYRTTRNHRDKRTSGHGGPLNGLEKGLKNTGKACFTVVAIGGVFIGALFLDHEVGELQDKMF